MAAEFGKLDFSTSFVPTSAFPLDGRTFFESLSAAQAAAATADEVGSKNSKYYFGQKLLVTENGVDTWYVITRAKTLVAEGSGGVNFTVDENTLTLSADGVLSVNTADEAAADNTKPITSAAVYTAVGNIEEILKTI